MSEPGFTSSARHLLGDDPVEDEDLDLFDRGPYVSRVVEILDKIANQTPSAVLGLMAPWGSGKTTLINLLRRRLESDGRWTVVEINPWMVADLASMVEEFFAALLSAFPAGRKSKALRKRLGKYAQSVAPVTSPLKLVGVNAQDPLNTVGTALQGERSLEARRKELERALQKHSSPILLIADDLDRLQPDELLLVFKLVRLVGRLPNIYYLLAFDERTALDVLSSTALAKKDPSRGRAYLEKVIQVRLDMPPARPRQVGQLLDHLLEGIIAEHSVAWTDQDSYRLSRAYQKYMRRYLAEPRQVRRFCAQLETTYPLVRDEVDFADFIVITFLRTFHPGVVPLLVENRDELTRTKLELGTSKPSHEQRLQTWKDRLGDAGVQEGEVDHLLEMLGESFLVIKGARERMEYSGFHEERHRERRVDSVEYFDRYFYLGVGGLDIADATVRRAIQEVLEEKPGDSWQQVCELIESDSERVLDKLRRFTPATPGAAERLAPLIAAFDGSISDSGFLARAPAVHRIWTSELLETAEPESPAEFVQTVAATSSVLFAARAYRSMIDRLEEEGREPTRVQADMVEAVALLVRAELEQQAGRTPRETDAVIGLLHLLRALDPAADVGEWMRSQVRGGAWPLPDVLGLFVPVGSISSGGPSVPALGDPDLAMLNDLLGLAASAASLPSLEVDGEQRWRETDVSFGNRVRIMRNALARWAAGNEAEVAAATPLVDGIDGRLKRRRRSRPLRATEKHE